MDLHLELDHAQATGRQRAKIAGDDRTVAAVAAGTHGYLVNPAVVFVFIGGDVIEAAIGNVQAPGAGIDAARSISEAGNWSPGLGDVDGPQQHAVRRDFDDAWLGMVADKERSTIGIEGQSLGIDYANRRDVKAGNNVISSLVFNAIKLAIQARINAVDTVSHTVDHIELAVNCVEGDALWIEGLVGISALAGE